MAPVQTVDMDTNHNNNTDSNTDNNNNANSNNQSSTASFQSNEDHLVEEQQVQLEEQQEEQQSTQRIDQRDTFSVNQQQQQQQEEGEIELGQIRSHGNENTNEHEEEEEAGGSIRELSMNINTNTDINMTMDTDISLNSSSASSDEDITHEHDDNDDATTQITEINISQTASNDDTYYDNIHLNNINTNMNNLLWTEEERNSYQQRRRESLGIELNRIQRSNCIHFSILCTIPLALIAIVLFNSLSDDSPCVGFENVICERNERSFLNAFGNKCVCYAFTL